MGLVHCTGASSVNSGKIGSKDAGDGDGVELNEFAVRNRSVESNPCHSPERGWYRSSESVAAYCIKAQYCMYSVAERNVRHASRKVAARCFTWRGAAYSVGTRTHFELCGVMHRLLLITAPSQ
jgi:hypothetical protein